MDKKLSLSWYALLFPITQLTLWWYLMSLIAPEGSGEGAWISVGAALLFLCAVTDFLLFKTLRQSAQLRITIQRQKMMEDSVNAQQKRGALLHREVEEAGEIRRELSNRLAEAAVLLQSRRMEDARCCMDNAAELFPAPKRFCAHPVADTIISDKLALCRSEKIPVDCQVQIPSELGIPDVELCAVLGNLMDNAIEACHALPEGVPCGITVRGRVNGGFLVLRIQNPVSEEKSVRSGGTLLECHGWGISIVRQIAEGRGGRLTTERVDGQFVSTVWISTSA